MFITNNKKNLKERLEELISISEELKFLIGFFYFSGAQELYLPLKKNREILLKILVGLKIDELNNQLIEYATTDDEKQSLEEIRNTFCYSLSKAFNRDEFDHQKYFEQAKYFVQLIKNNQLIIRKTKKPNHSKLYIFNFATPQSIDQR